jgi:hypothetical protein
MSVGAGSQGRRSAVEKQKTTERGESMRSYDRAYLNQGRKELGSLLQIEEGRIFYGGSAKGVDVSVEFRTGGILIHSVRSNVSDVIPFSTVHRVSLEGSMHGEEMGDYSLILLMVGKNEAEDRIYLKLENPEFLIHGLEKKVRESMQKNGAKHPVGSFGDTLRELNKLLQEGLLTEEEYADKKATILTRMTEE